MGARSPAARAREWPPARSIIASRSPRLPPDEAQQWSGTIDARRLAELNPDDKSRDRPKEITLTHGDDGSSASAEFCDDLRVPFLAKFQSTLYALLRIVAGFLFFQHGLPKLFGGFGRDAPVELMSQMGLAGIIEVFGGAAIAIGLFTSPVAFIASGEMAVAYFQAHAPRSFWPIVNGGELAALYCFLFLYVAAVGPGKWSVDALIGRGRRSRR
jgi:putative oxidoreductase